MAEPVRGARKSKRARGGWGYARAGALIPLLFCFCWTCSAQTTRTEADAPQAHPVTLDGKTIFEFRLPFRGVSPEERASLVSARIKKCADDRSIPTTTVTVNETGISSDIMAGDLFITGVLDDDAQIQGTTRQALAAERLLKIRSAIEEYRHNYSIRRIIVGVLSAVAATLVVVAILIVGSRFFRRIRTAVVDWARQQITSSKLKALSWIGADQVQGVLGGVFNFLRFAMLLIVLYIYAQSVLSFLPWTQGLASRLLSLSVAPVKVLTTELWEQIPKLFFIAVVAIVTAYILKSMRVFFRAIETKKITFQNFYPDWAQPTYKVLRLLVIAFAVMIAYPYIPGSSSEAFKGISIFLGILFSLGSTSLIANIVAGTMLTYMRAFKEGDRVKIGEYTGDVLRTRLQVTHLRTVKNEEVVVPNSVVISGQILNYSSQAHDGGLILHTSVTIGYDTPWRQIHALLLMAAERTQGLLREPPPFVLQRSLDDFYVNYELNVYTDTPQQMLGLYSDLHQNIQDAFNEYGVQIMSPNYIADRAAPTFVPKERWYAAPAKSFFRNQETKAQDAEHVTSDDIRASLTDDGQQPTQT